MKKCVLYSCVSTDKQQCLNQIIEMTEYTKKSNLQIVKTYQDDSTSSRKEISQRVIPPNTDKGLTTTSRRKNHTKTEQNTAHHG